MKVLVGSLNPVKIAAVREAFKQYFSDVEVQGKKVLSGVSDQPQNQDIFTGAQNRASNVRQQFPNYDFYVGIEGGIIELYGRWYCNGVICIINKEGHVGLGTSPHFEVPARILEGVQQGQEMGPLVDMFTGLKNTKHDQGIIGILTRGKMNRTQLYVPGVLCALIPFVNKDLF